ncbi:MAG: hypothetical protein SD837_21970 [Candidatus Electrothrix scaldis]|nr:MAG: hypothetical protein SD837_21970 [Candidatus Electrothrix sp. GW3-3]
MELLFFLSVFIPSVLFFLVGYRLGWKRGFHDGFDDGFTFDPEASNED